MNKTQTSHGRYYLIVNHNGELQIRRNDSDHSRAVATIDSADQWLRFKTALERGEDEVSAVHAIDNN